jgi:hypothetical protein
MCHTWSAAEFQSVYILRQPGLLELGLGRGLDYTTSKVVAKDSRVDSEPSGMPHIGRVDARVPDVDEQLIVCRLVGANVAPDEQVGLGVGEDGLLR